MKRALLGIGLAALIAAAIQAPAGGAGVDGKVLDFTGAANGQPDSSIDFDVIRKNGKDKRVKNFTFELEEQCDGGETIFVSSGAPTMKVDGQGRFEGNDPSALNRKLKGEIDGQAAGGRISIKFTPSMGPDNCKTGSLRWHAAH